MSAAVADFEYEHRLREVEKEVAIMQYQMVTLTTSVNENTAAVKEVVEQLARTKGGITFGWSMLTTLAVIAAFAVDVILRLKGL